MSKGLPTTRDIVFFDLETTGLDVDNDRVLQLGVLKFKTDGSWSRHMKPAVMINMKLNPERRIPKEASDVNGITDEMVSKKKTFAQIAKKLYQVFKGCDVCGYNSKRFDVPLLQAEFKRCGIDWEPVNQIDAFQIYNQMLPRTLAGALRTYCAEELEGAHDAMADIKATVEVVWAQLMRHPELHKKTPGEIEALLTDPNEVDIAGKLVRNEDGEIVLNFSKHKGKPISQIDNGFWNWCEKNSVLTQDTWAHVNKERRK